MTAAPACSGPVALMPFPSSPTAPSAARAHSGASSRRSSSSTRSRRSARSSSSLRDTYSPYRDRRGPGRRGRPSLRLVRPSLSVMRTARYCPGACRSSDHERMGGKCCQRGGLLHQVIDEEQHAKKDEQSTPDDAPLSHPTHLLYEDVSVDGRVVCSAALAASCCPSTSVLSSPRSLCAKPLCRMRTQFTYAITQRQAAPGRTAPRGTAQRVGP
jgi:hypothetical protein